MGAELDKPLNSHLLDTRGDQRRLMVVGMIKDIMANEWLLGVIFCMFK